MREYLFKGSEYQECVKNHVYDNMKKCERLAKAMEVLNWKWADASADNGIPNAMEIHNAIIELFEEFEHEILGKPIEEALMKFDGSYTIKTGGLILRWRWNTKTFELYDFEIMFDLWEYMI
jgi:hypothetical protein